MFTLGLSTYSKEEVDLLNERLLDLFSELLDNCAENQHSEACKTCKYRALCHDLDSAVTYTAKVLYDNNKKWRKS